MIRISASAFDILWSDLGPARPLAPLRVRSVGSTERERAEIREAVYDNLAERELFAGGRLDPELVARLETLAGADLYVECEALTGLDDDLPVRAVAAAGRKRAVLAVQPSRTIGLSAIRDTEIWAAAVGLLPPLEPGPGFGVSLPASVLGSPVEDPLPASYRKQLAEVLTIQSRPVLGAGQFSVRVREGGRVRRAGGVSWFVTDVGAYLGTVVPGRGGQDWVTVTPADPGRVASRLAGLVP